MEENGCLNIPPGLWRENKTSLVAVLGAQLPHGSTSEVPSGEELAVLRHGWAEPGRAGLS